MVGFGFCYSSPLFIDARIRKRAKGRSERKRERNGQSAKTTYDTDTLDACGKRTSLQTALTKNQYLSRGFDIKHYQPHTFHISKRHLHGLHGPSDYLQAAVNTKMKRTQSEFVLHE